MCLDCGCNMPHERHGDERHLVIEDFQAAAKANGHTVQATWQNVQRAMANAVDWGGQKPAQAGATAQPGTAAR